VRNAAIVCVVVGGMFMGGAGAAAFATPGPVGSDDGSSSSGGTQSTGTGTGTPVGGLHLPNLSTLTGFANSSLSRFTFGSIPSPTMNLPWLVPNSLLPTLAALPGPGTPGLTAPSFAPLTVGAPVVQVSGVQQAPADPTPPANVQTTDSGNLTPTTSVQAAVQPLVPDSQPVTTNNAPPGRVPFDPNKPFVPQLLPPPLVMLLMAAAQRIPLASLVITPLLNAKLPPFIADVVIPALLANIVVPTAASGATVPDPPTALSNVSVLSKPAGVSLPAELGLTGMDVPQAPGVTPSSLAIEPPQSTSPTNGDVTAMSDPVSFRAGYSDYLRNAGMAQITAIAVPGAAAILLFTLGGGFIGYRQARAGHVIRAEGISRFLR
jgi:hypothetical protein